jgi:hypothetical protein
MMRELLCAKCAKGAANGVVVVFAGTPDEPAEHARVVSGRARTPTANQRTIRVFADGTESTHEMPRAFFNCDHCNGEITPGDRAWCRTIWIPSRQPEPPEWEHDYLDTSSLDRV